MPPSLLARTARRAGASLLLTARALSASAPPLSSASPSPAAQLAAIKALREASGAPMSDVKAALVEAGWDADGAFGALRTKGLAAAQKKVWMCGRESERTRARAGEIGERRSSARRLAVGREGALTLSLSFPFSFSPSRRPPATPLRAWSASPSPARPARWLR